MIPKNIFFGSYNQKIEAEISKQVMETEHVFCAARTTKKPAYQHTGVVDAVPDPATFYTCSCLRGASRPIVRHEIGKTTHRQAYGSSQFYMKSAACVRKKSGAFEMAEETVDECALSGF